MSRLARVVAPGFPHHITQRGNRRQETFFEEEDYQAYLDFMAEWCGKCKVAVWAYCLMPNHIHLIVVPESMEGLRRAIGEAHRRYTCRINFREGWRGHLWQGRFASFIMDEAHLMAAARYVELNPVRAGLVAEAGEYAWSSAPAHLAAKDDGLVKVGPLLEMVSNWTEFLAQPLSEKEARQFQRHARTGRPLGDEAFVGKLEKKLKRTLRANPVGRRPSTRKQDTQD
jgi:putative transposase